MFAKMKNVTKGPALALALVFGASTLGGCAAGSGLVVGAVTAAGLKAVGVDSGTANVVGVGVGLMTAEGVGAHQRQQRELAGQCVEQSSAVRGSHTTNQWEERRDCVRRTQGYQTGPYGYGKPQ